MSQRPAANLINQLSQVRLTKLEAQELITDLDQVKSSLTLGIGAIGELMAIAANENNEAGVTPDTLTSASWLIYTLTELIQACNEQENDFVSYVQGEFSVIGAHSVMHKSEGEHDNAHQP